MYCSLTCHLMNKNLASIERHVQGKKYRKAKGKASCSSLVHLPVTIKQDYYACLLDISSAEVCIDQSFMIRASLS